MKHLHGSSLYCLLYVNSQINPMPSIFINAFHSTSFLFSIRSSSSITKTISREKGTWVAPAAVLFPFRPKYLLRHSSRHGAGGGGGGGGSSEIRSSDAGGDGNGMSSKQTDQLFFSETRAARTKQMTDSS
ncbi:hypothetical protein GPALN_004151 [Globodera pallida]|nr:hypothetical protein GPALN_004151 [Globodera pallida]